jgi:hypothetical protein
LSMKNENITVVGWVDVEKLSSFHIINNIKV